MLGKLYFLKMAIDGLGLSDTWVTLHNSFGDFSYSRSEVRQNICQSKFEVNYKRCKDVRNLF
jgi:hypothetical protein